MDGAAYQVIFTFTGIKPGEATVTVAERSPICGNLDHVYAVKVDHDLKIDGASREELLDAFGDGDVKVSFGVEWSE